MEADASALDMPSDCCYFVVKAAAADAAPALNYFSSILHRSAVFTQNLGQTRSVLTLKDKLISQNLCALEYRFSEHKVKDTLPLFIGIMTYNLLFKSRNEVA